jgi:hypothetical protein
MSDKLAIFSQLVLGTVVMLSMQGINQLPGLESRRVSTRLEDFYVQLDNAAKGPYSTESLFMALILQQQQRMIKQANSKVMKYEESS